MSDVFTAADLLSHLKRCGECDYYVGTPMACTGQNDGSKKGFWYEKCLNNAQPIPDSCNHFAWRQDIPRGKLSTGKKTPCPGAMCRETTKPNSCNVECTFGVCLRCCRHIQTHLIGIRSCGVPSHRKGVVYPTAESTPSSKEEPKPQRRGRGRPKKAKDAAKDSDVEIVDDDDGVSAKAARTPTRGPPKRQSYATPTGPLYQARMSALDAKHRLEVERHAERAKQDRAQAFQRKVSLRWWTQDGLHPENAEVVVDNPSSFHPKDIPHLVDLYQCDTQRFDYYDSKKGVWYGGSRFTAARDLDKLTPDDLCFRSPGVTWGPGMPGQTRKRPLPDDSVDNDTPRWPGPPFTQYPITPSATPRIAQSPTPTEPPMSGSSAYTDDSDRDPFLGAFDFTPTTFDEGAYTYTDINDTQPRLPALFASEPEITYASTSTSLARPHAVELDLTTAPRGRGAHPWPWRYVCDMAAGFAAVRCLEDGQPHMETADAFKEVFKTKFKITTYREQIRAWRAAGKVKGERERWIQYGRTEPGEWLTFMRQWRQGR